jgi:hypothetical protein
MAHADSLSLEALAGMAQRRAGLVQQVLEHQRNFDAAAGQRIDACIQMGAKVEGRLAAIRESVRHELAQIEQSRRLLHELGGFMPARQHKVDFTG